MNLWNEIWGCVNYLNIPYDTIMDMPVYVRKFWIQKHNMQNEAQNKENSTGSGKEIDGIGINAYAQIEQNSKKQ